MREFVAEHEAIEQEAKDLLLESLEKSARGEQPEVRFLESVTLEQLLPGGEHGEHVVILPYRIFDDPLFTTRRHTMSEGLGRWSNGFIKCSTWDKHFEVDSDPEDEDDDNLWEELKNTGQKILRKSKHRYKKSKLAKVAYGARQDNEGGWSIFPISEIVEQDKQNGGLELLQREDIVTYMAGSMFSLGKFCVSTWHRDNVRLPGVSSLFGKCNGAGKIWIICKGINQGHGLIRKETQKITAADFAPPASVFAVWTPINCTICLPGPWTHYVITCLFMNV